jgi:hypothetical protein
LRASAFTLISPDFNRGTIGHPDFLRTVSTAIDLSFGGRNQKPLKRLRIPSLTGLTRLKPGENEKVLPALDQSFL